MSALRWLQYAALIGCAALRGNAQEVLRRDPANVSMDHEVQLAIEKGIEFSTKHQGTDGAWGEGRDRLLATSLMLLAWISPDKPDAVTGRSRGYAVLRALLTPPAAGLKTCDLAAAWVALNNARDPMDADLLRQTAARVRSTQMREAGGPTGGAFRRFLDDTSKEASVAPLQEVPMILLALQRADALADAGAKNRTWSPDGALRFVLSCRESVGSSEAGDRGIGFATLPRELAPPGGAPASLSSTAAGILALLQLGSVDVSANEASIRPAVLWLGSNQPSKRSSSADGALEDFLITLALDTAHISQLQSAAGGKIIWSRLVAEDLINSQNSDGSWTVKTDAGGSAAILTTAFRLVTLQIIHRGW